MMRVKLIVAGEERWLKHFYYEYFYPIEEKTSPKSQEKSN